MNHFSPRLHLYLALTTCDRQKRMLIQVENKKESPHVLWGIINAVLNPHAQLYKARVKVMHGCSGFFLCVFG